MFYSKNELLTDLKLMFAGSRRAEQLSLCSQQRIVVTVEESVLNVRRCVRMVRWCETAENYWCRFFCVEICPSYQYRVSRHTVKEGIRLIRMRQGVSSGSDEQVGSSSQSTVIQTNVDEDEMEDVDVLDENEEKEGDEDEDEEVVGNVEKIISII